MAEVTRARCTVCGKEFFGKDCVKEAEAHEKIPVNESIYEVGDILIYPKSHGEYSTIHAIHTIGVSTDEHKVMYNGMCNCTNVFKLPVFEQNDVRTINKVDFLNRPDCAELREKMFDLYINDVLLGIYRDKEQHKIDKILGWEKGD